MQYRQIPPKKRAYILSLLRLAPQYEEPADQAQVVLRARLIAMTPTKQPTKRRPR
jgi:hypothetical protein